MAFEMGPVEFDAAVGRAIDDIPDDLFRVMENCVILVEDDAPPDDPDLLGLYEGTPLTERDSGYGAVLPDRIRLFRRNILAMCDTAEEVEDEVYVTVVHEIAHHFGIDDARLDELGWD